MNWLTNFVTKTKKVKTINLNGSIFDVSDIVADSYTGQKSFNLYYADFDGLFSDLLENIVEPKDRINSCQQGLTSLSFLSDEAKNLLDELIEVVNFSARPIVSEDRKRRYKNVLKSLAKLIVEERIKRGFSQEDLAIVPLKGGSYFWNFLDDKKMHDHTLAINCKRIPVKEKNSFGFGMNLERSSEYLKNNHLLGGFTIEKVKKIRIVELCIVSGMTTLGFLLYLENNNLMPEEIEINTIAISQQGYEFIRDFAKSRKIKINFLTGGMYYRLGNYYVSRRDELLTLDGKLVIGDVRLFLD